MVCMVCLAYAFDAGLGDGGVVCSGFCPSEEVS